MRVTGILLALITTLVVLAGCAEQAAPDTTVTTVEVEPGLVVAAGHGVLRGSVFDDQGRGLPDARVSLLRTQFFAATDDKGAFEFQNVTAGTHSLVATATGFQQAFQEVVVPDGGIANATIQLLPDEERGSGYRPHTHDFWGEKTTYRLLDSSIDLSEPPAGSPYPDAYWMVHHAVIRPTQNTSYWFVPLRESPESGPPIVLPGTKEMTMTLHWTTSTLDELGVCYQAVAGKRTCLGPHASGEPWTIRVTPDMADSGHQAFSLWRIELYHRPMTATMTPVIATGNVDVVIDLAKGNLPLDPPHEDFWANGNERLVADEEIRIATICCSNHPGLVPEELVPPGTTRIRIEHTWRFEGTGAGPLDFDYRILVRTADMNPQTTGISDYHEPEAAAGSAAEFFRTYEFPVEEVQTDAFYQGRSNWHFVMWNPTFDKDSYAPRTRPVIHHVVVTAFNDAL